MPFKILKRCTKTNARTSTLILNHHSASLPTFMPVATHGILKAKHVYEDEIILGNTFHLRNLNRDLHDFMGVKGGMLTDSGGFQIISLRNSVNEDGVVFLDYSCDGRRISDVENDGGAENDRGAENEGGAENDRGAENDGGAEKAHHSCGGSAVDNLQYCRNVYCLNTKCTGCTFTLTQKTAYLSSAPNTALQKHFLLTPEKSIAIQNMLNSDIAMQLDDVIRPCSPKNRHLTAVKRSIRWLDRCLAHTQNSTQLLFPIVQGGLFNDLRMLSVDEIVRRGAQGIAIGGLCGGEDKKMFCDVVFSTVNYIRERIECPVYVMGVGYPEDIVVSVMLGSDMSDCVYPTRTARFGRMFTDYGDINVNSFVDDDLKRTTSANSSKDPSSHTRNANHSKNPSNHTRKRAYTGTVIRNGAVYNGCECQTCTRFSINYLKMIRNTPNFCILMTEHNLFYLRGLISRMKRGIENGTLDVFIKEWMMKRFGGDVPDWVKYAYNLVNI